MRKYKYIIIGGGIAGTTAAETIRQKDGCGGILIVSDELKPLYSRVLLPKFLEGAFSEDKINLRKKDDFKKKNIDFIFGERVLSLDAKNNKIILKSGGIFYEKLLIATGARSRKIKTDEDIFYFQNFQDADFLKKRMKDVKRVVILGASFNSLELAEAFSKNNIDVSLLVRGDNFLGSFMDDSANKLIEGNLKKNNISVFFREEFDTLLKDGDKKYVLSKKGNKFDCDILIASIGTELNIDFLKSSGVKVERGVLTDQYLKTNIENVFAAGDISEFYDIISEKYQIFRNWAFAFMQGKIAGLNMTGEHNIFRHVSSYNVVNFALNIAIIGDLSLSSGVVVVNRGDLKKNAYSRIFIENGIVKGALQINMNKEQRVVSSLIENRVDVSSFLDEISDYNFDLNKLIS